MSLQPGTRTPSLSIESLRSRVLSLQKDNAGRAAKIAALTSSKRSLSIPSSPAEKLVLTQTLGAAVREAEELRAEAGKRNFLLKARDLQFALAGAIERPEGATASPGFFQRMKSAMEAAGDVCERFARELRGDFSSDESDTGEATKGRWGGDKPTALGGGGLDPCAEEKKRIEELSTEITNVSAECNILTTRIEVSRSEGEDLRGGIVELQRRMPPRDLVQPRLTLRDCEKHHGKVKKKLRALRRENDSLMKMGELYERQLKEVLPSDTAEKSIADAAASRLQLAKLKATLAAMTAKTHLYWTKKDRSAHDLTKEKYKWKDLELHIEAIAAKARSLMRCKDLRAELRDAKRALQALKDENENLLLALHTIVPYKDPPGADAAKASGMKRQLKVIREAQNNAEAESKSLNSYLRYRIRRAIEGAPGLGSTIVDDLGSCAAALAAEVRGLEPTANPVRFSFLNERIAEMEAPGSPLKAESQESRKLLADLRSERLLLMPNGKLRAYATALQKEAIPPIPVLPDVSFQDGWNSLFRDVQKWCGNYYPSLSKSVPVSYDELVKSAHLLGFYLRDVLIHRDYVERMLRTRARPDIATGIVFRILVEEVFEPIRFMLHLRFQEPKEKWMIKPQYKAAFEAEGMADVAAGPRFQSRETFLQRLGKRPPPQEVWEHVEPPKKRVKRDHFNFFRTFEDSEEQQGGRDNDDDIALNTARAKLMTSIFSLKNNPCNRPASTLRSKVSSLIISTLRPLSEKILYSTPSQGAEARGPYPSTTYAEDPPEHAAGIEKIVGDAFDLAVKMSSQPTLIHPLFTDLMSMKAFDSTSMTLANHPIGTTPSSRADELERLYSSVAKHMVDSGGAGKVGCYFRPVCEVMPALVRRGQVTKGQYSWAKMEVLVKAKVYVGGPDEEGSNLRFTVHEYPYGLEL